MPYYLVSRTDYVGYDEYDAFVVKAKDEKEALSFCYSPFYDEDERYENLRTTDQNFRSGCITIEKLDAKRQPGPVLGSFNAG